MAELEYFKTIVKELEELRKENAELREKNKELLAKNEEYELGIKYLRADYEKLENFNRVKDDLDREAERLAEQRKQKAEALKEYERSLLSHISGLEDRLSESCESLKHLIMNAENNLGKNAGVSKTTKEFEEEEKAAREAAVQKDRINLLESTKMLNDLQELDGATPPNDFGSFAEDEAIEQLCPGDPAESKRDCIDLKSYCLLKTESVTPTFCTKGGAKFLSFLNIVSKHNCVGCGEANCQEKFHACEECAEEIRCKVISSSSDSECVKIRPSGPAFAKNMMNRRCDHPSGECPNFGRRKYYVCEKCKLRIFFPKLTNKPDSPLNLLLGGKTRTTESWSHVDEATCDEHFARFARG